MLRLYLVSHSRETLGKFASPTQMLVFKSKWLRKAYNKYTSTLNNYCQIACQRERQKIRKAENTRKHKTQGQRAREDHKVGISVLNLDRAVSISANPTDFEITRKTHSLAPTLHYHFK